MMKSGSLDSGGDWVETTSLARLIEEEMITAELIDLDEEDEEATLNRRKTFVAIATAIVKHLTASLEITISTGDLRAASETGGKLPASSLSFTVSSGTLTLAAGSIRSAADSKIPPSARTLTGKVR